jgi:hypothetical protein
MSWVERDLCAPPAEARLRSIAKILDLNTDEVLAAAGKIAADLMEIVRRNPVELGALLRARVKATPI